MSSFFEIQCTADIFSPLTHVRSILLSTLRKKHFEDIVEKKEENVGNQHFLLFLQCFQSFQRQLLLISVLFIVLLANAWGLDQFCFNPLPDMPIFRLFLLKYILSIMQEHLDRKGNHFL